MDRLDPATPLRFAPPDPSPGVGPLGLLFALALVLALALVALAVLRRKGLGRTPPAPGSSRWLTRLLPALGEDAIRLVQSTRLTPRASVHLVRWGGREWLLACTEQQVTVLAERPDAAAAAEAAASASAATPPAERP